MTCWPEEAARRSCQSSLSSSFLSNVSLTITMVTGHWPGSTQKLILPFTLQCLSTPGRTQLCVELSRLYRNWSRARITLVRLWSPITGFYQTIFNTCSLQRSPSFLSRQLLPVFNLFKQKNCKYRFLLHFVVTLFLVNIGDGIDYHQRHSENVGDLIQVNISDIIVSQFVL